MSKLTIIRKSLEADSRIKIVKAEPINYFPERQGYWSQTADFWVAPKIGMYAASELQKFLMSLIPRGLEPTQVDECRQHDEQSDLCIGVLYFDEKIAEERVITKTVITTTDDELKNTFEMVDGMPKNVYGFEDGKMSIDDDVTEDHLRRTWVRLYPDEATAKAVLEGRISSSYISPKLLERSRQRQNLVQRLAGG